MFAKARISQEIPGAAHTHGIADHLHFMGADTGQDPGEVMMAAAEGGDKAPAIKREGIIRFPFREKRFQKGGLAAKADHAIHREAAQSVTFADRFKRHHGLQRKPGRDVKAGGDFTEKIKAGAAPGGILGVEGRNAIEAKISLARNMRGEALGLGCGQGAKACNRAKGQVAKAGHDHAASPRIAGTIRERLWRNMAS